MSHPYIHAEGRVLAAIDASLYTDSICAHAAWAAQRLAAPLEFVHALDRQARTPPVDLSGSLALGEQEALLAQLATLDEKRSQLAQEHGRLLLAQARERAAAEGVPSESRLRHGALVDTLVELEPDVRLFVLGKRGAHAHLAKGHLGSELERVVRAVHRPLLVASRSYTDIARVLVAFDGSATTRKGVEMVAASPLFRGLGIRVVTVGADTEANRIGLRWALDTLAAAGLEAEGSVLPGEPEVAISDYARDEHADLLVMGAYGHSRIRQLIVGSTTTALLRTCRMPVLLLR